MTPPAQDARSAWEDGFSIVAAALNSVLAKRCPGSTIEAAPTRPGLTLRDCRARLLDALRRSLISMPEPDKIAPWCVGYVNGRKNDETRVGALIYDPEPDETLKYHCEFLCNHRKEWKPTDWKSLIVQAAVRDAREWRGFLDRLDDGEAADPDYQSAASQDEAAQRTADSPGAKRGANANARMIDKLAKLPESKHWTADKWANALGYRSASTIKETKTWKGLATLRDAARAERRLTTAQQAERKNRR